MEPGYRIANRYEVVRRVDRGSFGYIYLGTDTVSREKVAVKVVCKRFFAKWKYCNDIGNPSLDIIYTFYYINYEVLR